jgi:hypothetical protein
VAGSIAKSEGRRILISIAIRQPGASSPSTRPETTKAAIFLIVGFHVLQFAVWCCPISWVLIGPMSIPDDQSHSKKLLISDQSALFYFWPRHGLLNQLVKIGLIANVTFNAMSRSLDTISGL